MVLPKIFFALIFFCLSIFPSSVFAQEPQEGIFIEAISELNNGKLALDEIRTKPTTFVSSGKVFSIEADGCYICDSGLGENPHIAQDRARADAKRMLSEQASIFIKSVSEVKKGQLTRDEVHTLSVTVMQIKSESFTTEVVDGATQYRCHVKALLEEQNIFDRLNPADKEKFQESVRRTIEIERENARLNSELQALKTRYKNASRLEREKIAAQVKRNEEEFSAVQWNEKGFELYGRNDFDGAIECFQKAIAANPNYASPWNGLGYIANYQRNFDKAVEYFYKAIQLDPDSSAPQNNLGYAYTYKGDFDKAIACYKRAAQLDPKDAAPLVNLGNVYDALKNPDEAIKYYQKALEVAPDYVNALNSLGYTYIQKGDFDKGMEFCQKALKLDPNYAAAWNALGYCFNQKKKFYKAAECCRKAVKLNKSYANAWNNLGYACSKLNRNEESWSAYRNAVKFAPNIQLYRNNLEIANKRLTSFKSL